MRRIWLVGLCLAVLAGTSVAAQNLDPKILNLLQQVIQQVKLGELTQSHLEALVKHQNPFEIEKKSATAKQSAAGAVRLLVDYRRPLADMIKDCRFADVHSKITEEHFSIKLRPNREVEMRLFHFKRSVGTAEAILEMEELGYRPAELPELLAFARAYPNEQRKYPIICLGSVWQPWDSEWFVPSLDSYGGYRELFLERYGLEGYGDGIKWTRICRFLAVRKS